ANSLIEVQSLTSPVGSLQAHSSNELIEARIRTDRIKLRLDLQPDEQAGTLLICLIHPGEGFIFVAESDINISNQDRINVLLRGSLLQFLNYLLRLGSFTQQCVHVTQVGYDKRPIC